MATKKKTSVSKKQGLSTARPRNYSDLYRDDKTRPTIAGVATTPKASTTSTAVSTVSTADWQKEYAHVVSDLRMLLTVSGVLFAIIIIAGFFI
ncbi:MAG: hypothetical protein KF832_24450 [Caldilineaceae bacterium]|nr:hypothetical protein [Caldilineaceae bacterium]